MRELLPETTIDEFSSTLEYNTAINWKSRARLRINLFKQRNSTGMVIRRIHTQIPSLSALSLPDIYAELAMERRGLILLVGSTGSGKSTSLASMLEHRNLNASGHIITIEDPIEFLLSHKKCIITQRDIGIDTYSFSIGLKNALRQAPDVIVIGEIRDREAMEHAITFAETGHLCIATLHANNANQAIERILNFFPDDRAKQILQNLSLNLKAILSQRLILNNSGERTVAIEIMLNQGLIKQLINEGMVKELKECIENGASQGMQSFDQHILALYFAGIISEKTALTEADNPANMRLAMKQKEVSTRYGSNLSQLTDEKKQF
jgi:twitching motility protein PilU